MSAHVRSLVLLLVLAVPVRAQSTLERPPHRGWTAVRLAKWTLVGTAAAFGAYALVHSTRAEQAYADLHRFCEREPRGCDHDTGHYADGAAERLYQRAVTDDRDARIGIFGGQVALLGGVALFIYDLRNGSGPVNIPYPSGASRASPRGVAVGMRMAF
jgi:hypothetical protein